MWKGVVFCLIDDYSQLLLEYESTYFDYLSLGENDKKAIDLFSIQFQY